MSESIRFARCWQCSGRGYRHKYRGTGGLRHEDPFLRMTCTWCSGTGIVIHLDEIPQLPLYPVAIVFRLRDD